MPKYSISATNQHSFQTKFKFVDDFKLKVKSSFFSEADFKIDFKNGLDKSSSTKWFMRNDKVAYPEIDGFFLGYTEIQEPEEK